MFPEDQFVLCVSLRWPHFFFGLLPFGSGAKIVQLPFVGQPKSNRQLRRSRRAITIRGREQTGFVLR